MSPKVVGNHCPKGHEYTPENSYYAPSRPGTKNCRICMKARSKAATERERAAIAEAKKLRGLD